MLPCSSSSDIDESNRGATGQGNCYLWRRGGVRIERGMGEFSGVLAMSGQ